MKKTLLLSFILLAAMSMFSQVARELVLVEVGTGTGCPYCPGAAMALDDLYTNGHAVAGIEYHNYNTSDPFNTPEAAARTSYYGITGYPTAQFDGEYDEYVGGSNSTSLYSTYLPKVNTRLAIQSEFNVEIYGQHTGNNYTIDLRITKESAYSGTNLKVRFALTESDIVYAWQGQPQIDFTERLMAPDQNGTAVSFANVGDEVVVNLSFTYNSTWVASNCELIAWIQDDGNKYALQTSKVALNALQPFQAVANFTQSAVNTCEGSTVSYTDLSGGQIVSWDWTFEGGTPATSTLQNPVVSYNSTGSFDVTLEVADATITSTMAVDNLIHVIVSPVQAPMPVGEVVACAGSTYTYEIPAVPDADVYVWNVTPVAAGTIVGTGTQGTFVSASNFLGDYSIKARADNFCGEGIWSAPLTCTVNYAPIAYLLSEGGGICEGSQGMEITQDGSETSISYGLYRNGVYTGTTVDGTGNPLSFGLQTVEGTYSVLAATDFCEKQMWGTPWIHYVTAPGQASLPEGSTVVCGDTETNYITPVVDDATSYNWVLTPAEAGVLTPDGREVVIAWSSTFSGVATLSVAAENQCGLGAYSNDLSIQLSAVPQPEIAGITNPCDFTSEVYTTTDQSGNSYEWVVEGGSITEGAGTSQITVMWSEHGQGTVTLTEVAPGDCIGNDEVTIEILNCTDIQANEQGELKIYPNPVDKVLNISISLKQESLATVTVMNAFGQLVYSENYKISTNETAIQVNTADINAGYYIIKVETNDGGILQQKFIKR